MQGVRMESFLNKLIESEEFSKLTNISINYLNFYVIFEIILSIISIVMFVVIFGVIIYAFIKR